MFVYRNANIIKPAKKRHQGWIPGDLASIPAPHHSPKMQRLTETVVSSVQFKHCIHIELKKIYISANV